MPGRKRKKSVVSKLPSPSPSRRPAIPNLKMGSPSAPNQNHANLGEGAAPMTEIASTEAVGGTPPAGLLMSAGRTLQSAGAAAFCACRCPCCSPPRPCATRN